MYKSKVLQLLVALFRLTSAVHSFEVEFFNLGG